MTHSCKTSAFGIHLTLSTVYSTLGLLSTEYVHATYHYSMSGYNMQIPKPLHFVVHSYRNSEGKQYSQL